MGTTSFYSNSLKVLLRNMDNGELYTFQCNCWLSKKLGDKKLSVDIPASVRGKLQLKSKCITSTYTYVEVYSITMYSQYIHRSRSQCVTSTYTYVEVNVFTAHQILVNTCRSCAYS